VEERVKTRDVDAVSALEEGSKAAFYSIQRRMDGIEDTMATNSQRLSRLEESNKILVASNQQLVEQNKTVISLLQQQLTGRLPAAATAATTAAPEGEFLFFRVFCHLSFVY
jgi:archaellum component FlaC